MDFEDKVTLIYCVCSDALENLNIEDDKQTKMSTAEVMGVVLTATVVQYGNISQIRELLLNQGYYPSMLSLSRLYRRWHRIPEEVWRHVMWIHGNRSRLSRISLVAN